MCSSGDGLQPDRGAVRQQQVEGRRVGRRCRPASRSPPRREGCDRLLERAPLVAPVGGRCRRGRGSRARLQPATRSISRFSSTNGTLERVGQQAAERRLAGAAQADQRDAAARAPRRRRPVPNSSASAEPRAPQRRRRRGRAAARGSAAIRASRRDVAEQLGERQSSAAATWRRTRIEALPTPYSRFARCRSETPDASASDLARHAPARAQRAHPLAERDEERLAFGRVGRLVGAGIRRLAVAHRSIVSGLSGCRRALSHALSCRRPDCGCDKCPAFT